MPYGYNAPARPPPLDAFVPANVLQLHPCLTREMLAQKSGVNPNDPRYFSMMVFDDLGCRLDPVGGWRMPEDCGTYSSENRVLCPGVDFVRSGFEDKIRALKFWKKVLPIVLKLVPIVGPMVAEAIAPLIDYAMEQLGELASTEMSEQLKRLVNKLLAALATIVAEVRTMAAGVKTAMRETFNAFGVTTKTLVDMLPRNAFTFDPAKVSLISYAGAREALSFSSALLGADLPSVRMLKAAAIGAPLAIRDFNTAIVAQDAQKMLVSTQLSVDYFAQARGTVSKSAIDNLVTSKMPPIKEVVDRGQSLAGEPLEISAHIAENLAGKRVDALALLDPGKIGALIPSDTFRREFLSEMAVAVTYSRMLEPAVREAEQSFARDHDALSVYVKSSMPEVWRVPERRAFERDVRARLLTAENRANQIVKDAVLSLAPFERGRGIV